MPSHARRPAFSAAPAQMPAPWRARRRCWRQRLAKCGGGWRAQFESQAVSPRCCVVLAATIAAADGRATGRLPAERLQLDPAALTMALVARFGELHAFGAFEQRRRKRRVLGDVVQEQFPSGAVAIL